MGNQSIISIEAVIDYIESHLDGKLELETVAEAVHYSKYHLHRLFTETVGMTIHDYVQRRQLTEAAKLLVFSDKPIIEIAFICGYESQQSFSLALDALLEIYLPGQEISTTTFREQDKADTGHRDMLLQLGFAEKELLTEFGYPTQRFVLPPKKQEAIQHG